MIVPVVAAIEPVREMVDIVVQSVVVPSIRANCTPLAIPVVRVNSARAKAYTPAFNFISTGAFGSISSSEVVVQLVIAAMARIDRINFFIS